MVCSYATEYSSVFICVFSRKHLTKTKSANQTVQPPENRPWLCKLARRQEFGFGSAEFCPGPVENNATVFRICIYELACPNDYHIYV